MPVDTQTVPGRWRTKWMSGAGLAVVSVLFASVALSQNRGEPGGQAAPMPASLSDAEFWRIFTTFSEPGGTFSTQNLTSNEAAVGEVAAQLTAAGRKGGAYLGVGPEQNFTYIAAIEPRLAFIVDIRRQAAIQHLMFKAIFELSPTRAEFIERLFALPAPPRAPGASDVPIHDLWLAYLAVNPDSAIAVRNLRAIIDHLTVTRKFALSADDIASLSHVYAAFAENGPAINYLTGMNATAPLFRTANFASLTMTVDTSGLPRSFLASDRSFALVKDMHARNMIIPVVGDFGGARALRAIGDYLRQAGTAVTAFYVSNVEQYLFRPVDKRVEFYGNVAALPLDSGSLLRRPGSAGSSPLPAPPFTPQSGDVALRTYVQQQLRPRPDQRPPMALCPALQFLNAYKSGLVNVYADAERCAR